LARHSRAGANPEINNIRRSRKNDNVVHLCGLLVSDGSDAVFCIQKIYYSCVSFKGALVCPAGWSKRINDRSRFEIFSCCGDKLFMKTICTPEYLARVELLSEEETERLLSRMHGKLPRRLEKAKFKSAASVGNTVGVGR